MTQKFIAERKLICEDRSTGVRKPAVVRIGEPYWAPGDPFASCPVEYLGLPDRFATTVFGIDTLHALQAASGFSCVESLLRLANLEYRILWESGEPYFNDDQEPPPEKKDESGADTAKNFIAERKLICEEIATGIRKPIIMRIGLPHWAPGDPFASCPVEYVGLFDEFADAKGVDTLQALQEAANIDVMLRHLGHKYKFFWDSGEAYVFD
jgi:hypothetical protein